MSRSLTVFIVFILIGLVAFGLLAGSDSQPTPATTTTPTSTNATSSSADGQSATSTPEDKRPVSYTPDSAQQLVDVDNPKPAVTISSPLTISGQARGQWFFEASAPVVLVDWDGRIIAEGHIQAEGDPANSGGTSWMTEEFVPFSGELKFSSPEDTGPQSVRGSLIIQRANPSDKPANDMAVEIPVRFRQ